MMKKYFVLTALTLTLAGGILAGCGEGTDIGEDSAKEIALENAGVAEADTSRFRITKDRDDGRTVYEVEFSVQEKEYSYDIAAADGEILNAEQDIDDNYTNSQNSQTSTSGTASQTDNGSQQSDSTGQSTDQQAADQQNTQQTTDQQNTQQSTGTQQTASVAVSEADAKKAALEKVQGATEQDMRIELELDDGKYVYEGDIIYQNKEYEFEIDANTGNFLKWSEENY